MRSPHEALFRGDPTGTVVSVSGEGLGAIVTTADGSVYETVWAGGEGLTGPRGSTMFDRLAQEPTWDDDEDEKRMRHLRAKKARAVQLQKARNDKKELQTKGR